MRLRNLILIFAALATVVVLAACGSSGQSGDDGGSNAQEQGQQEPQKETPDEQVAPQQGAQEDSGDEQASVEPPSDDTMKLTVPKMEQIEDDEIPTGLGTDETLFHDYAGVHIKNTGFPWDQQANVYIAGHRLGYPNTKSWLVFWNLDKLSPGDRLRLEDAQGRKYVYEVFDKMVVGPDDVSVKKPIEGKNIVTLQTCTLPDYKNRLLVRAELISG